jgi:Asp-tRNA(Asn)/Glu-tRNA(Gln) amidotransferase A subunit family amidase
MSEPCDLGAVDARRLIGRKALSPAELLESCIRRIERVNPALNAVVATDFERARAAAREAEAAVGRGEALAPLHGLPVGIKDLHETAGLRTTFGSALFADHVPDKDDDVVAAIRAAGGIIAAKTNTPEFGAGANTVNAVYGFTGNAFDPDRICGGSSGGSAVALATGMLPLASGSDLGGSLRTPAGYSGVVGFRPSPGLVPMGRRALAWSPMWVEGPMARNVADLCLMLSAMAGDNPVDPFSRPVDTGAIADPLRADLSGLRVAVSEDLGFAPVDNGIRAVLRHRVGRISEVFGSCDQVDPDLSGADRIFEVLRAVGFLAAHREKVEATPDKVGPNVTANVAQALTFTVTDVAQAEAEHSKLYWRFLKFMESYDLLICPVAAVPPFGKDQLYIGEINGEALKTYFSWIGITYGITLTAHPVLILPCGLDSTGTPFGLQLVGRRGQDARLLGIGAALEAELDTIAECRRPVPDLDVLTDTPQRRAG